MTQPESPSPTKLGELEAEIMRVVWQEGEATVQEVQRALEPTRSSAYTTVMTMMSRLAGKGLLKRRKEGRAYVYAPAIAQDAVAGSLLRSLVGRVFGGSSVRAIAQLIDDDEEVDDAELERLEKLIRAKRRRGKA